MLIARGDWLYIKDAALRNGEETKLAIDGHTVHFDSYYDQARDREHTCILIPKWIELGSFVRTKYREEALEEIHKILMDIMKGHELYILFFCLGPLNSEFSILCVQLTDSSCVAHSERLLYRPGYEEFVRQGNKAYFFKFIHSQGELNDMKVSKNLDERRVYIDPYDDTVYSTNTQYGGNSIGLKKLSLRLAIAKASKEGWLAEHMFIVGLHGPQNSVALHSTNEIIFSNVLVTENGKVHWLGKDCEIPKKGFNHLGKWWLGKEDANGREIPCSHPNARFTFELKI
ncbi:MAG: phosphoenolpyruvate carboxykinase domain-containing protein, partial [Candidatus Thermoplasmatota archaeon]|nr:phosphoenolpyruvate carboxykinase domain-containing protein [Candidatus Thermoplasmatota archaeon]